MATRQPIDKTSGNTPARAKGSKPQSGAQPAQILQRLESAPASIRPADVLQLQRTLGNRATERILQAKLKLGPTGDAYEQEADRVAQQVVRASPQPEVQREGVDEEELQAKPLHGLESGDVDTDVARSIKSAKGGGAPLDDGVRSSMEQGFGADFSGVRVHTGGQADALNRSLNARAFTTGKDIFFGKGQYNPGSSGGQELIAHELTHRMQQGATGVQRVQRLMTPADFKLATPGAFRGRSGIAPIDTLLTQYTALGGSSPDLQTRKQRLIALDAACTNYAGWCECPSAANTR